MNRYFFSLISCFCLLQQVLAQPLENKIPADAYAVAVINSDRFFDLVSIHEFNRSKMGEAFLDKVNEKRNGDFKGIEDFGIDLQSKIYIYSTRTDSVRYYGMLVPLNDANKLNGLLQGLGVVQKTSNGAQQLLLEDKKQVLMWDDQVLYMLSASLQESYFEDKQVAAKYGLQNRKLVDDYGGAYEVAPAPPITDTVDMYWEYEDMGLPVDSIPEDTYAEDRHEDEQYTDFLDDATGYDDYYASVAADDSIKSQLTSQWLRLEVARLKEMNVPFDHKSYKHSINKKALASLWIRNVDELYTDFIPALAFGKMLSSKHIAGGFERANIDLIVDGNQIKLDGSLQVAPNQAKLYRKMYKRKLNRKFFKYLDGNALGYMAYSVNTRAYLEEFPKLMAHYYGGFLSKYQGEMDLGATLFSLLLDEKAVGKMIKGDAVFMLTGVSEHEVKYTTYEYDEDYNSIEIEKTKKESLPNFLAMFSSDDMTLFKKIIALGIAKQEVTEANGIYTIKMKKSPIELHLLLKDGIVFFGTSRSDLQDIQHSRFQANMSAKQRNLLRNNNMALLFSSKELAKVASKLEVPASKEVLNLKEKIDAFGDFYFTSKGMKKNAMVATLGAELPSSHQNGLQYILYLMENVAFGAQTR